jgi:hypothetical protein
MSTAKTKPAAAAPGRERVSVALPRAGEREDPNLFVGINGLNYLLPKGKSSLVPPAVAAEIRRAERARDALDATMDSLQRASL